MTFFSLFGELFDALTIEKVTLISVLVTLTIFILSNQSSIKLKQVEKRREEYVKFIQLLQKIYKNDIEANNETKDLFFNTGVSMLLYGSKKMYKKYIFFRNYLISPIVEKSKYYNKNLTVYLIADMLETIRKEVSLTKFENLEHYEVLAFFINDLIFNPKSKKESFKAKYSIFMLKVEMFFWDRFNFIFLSKLYYFIIKPFSKVILQVFGFLLKLLFIMIKKIYSMINFSKNSINFNNGELYKNQCCIINLVLFIHSGFMYFCNLIIEIFELYAIRNKIEFFCGLSVLIVLLVLLENLDKLTNIIKWSDEVSNKLVTASLTLCILIYNLNIVSNELRLLLLILSFICIFIILFKKRNNDI